MTKEPDQICIPNILAWYKSFKSLRLIITGIYIVFFGSVAMSAGSNCKATLLENELVYLLLLRQILPKQRQPKSNRQNKGHQLIYKNKRK